VDGAGATAPSAREAVLKRGEKGWEEGVAGRRGGEEEEGVPEGRTPHLRREGGGRR